MSDQVLLINAFFMLFENIENQNFSFHFQLWCSQDSHQSFACIKKRQFLCYRTPYLLNAVIFFCFSYCSCYIKKTWLFFPPTLLWCTCEIVKMDSKLVLVQKSTLLWVCFVFSLFLHHTNSLFENYWNLVCIRPRQEKSFWSHMTLLCLFANEFCPRIIHGICVYRKKLCNCLSFWVWA